MIRVLCLFLCLALPVFAQAQTSEERDVGFIAGLIEENLNGVSRTIEIDGFAGALSSSATIERLTIADADGIWITMEGLTLSWDRGALLGGRLEIAELSAQRIALPRLPVSEDTGPSAESAPFALPELPVSINIGAITAERIEIGAPVMGQDLVFRFDGSVNLEGGEGTAQLEAERLEAITGRFSIGASYSNETNILGLDIDLTEGANGIAANLIGLPGTPSVKLNVTGTGPVTDYAAAISLATDGVERVAGDVTYITRDGETDFQADLGGDVTLLFAPQYRDFFGQDIQLSVLGNRAVDGSLTLKTLEIETQALALSGEAELAPDGWPRRLALDGKMADAEGGRVLLPIPGDETFVDEAVFTVAFDAEAGDQWFGTFSVLGFARPDIAIPVLELTGGGTLPRPDTDTTGLFTASLEYGARGIWMNDPALLRAIGAELDGLIDVQMAQGGNLTLDRLTLNGEGLRAELAALLITDEDGSDIALKLTAEIADLARLGPLTGLDISGAAGLDVTGNVAPLNDSFDLAIVADTTDLAFAIAQADPLLEGAGHVSFRAVRNTEGTRIEGLDLETIGIKALADVTLSSAGSNASFDISLPNTRLIEPQLSGAARVTGEAGQALDGTVIGAVDITAPGGLAARLTALIGPEDLGYDSTFNGRINVTNLSAYAPLVGQAIGGAITAEFDATATLADLAFQSTFTADTTSISLGIPDADVLLRGIGQVEAELSRTSEGLIRLRNLNASTPNLTLSGAFETDGRTGQANYDARLRDVGLFTDEISGPVSAEGTATLENSGAWRIRTSASGPQGITADVAGTVATNGQLNLDLSGALPLAIANRSIAPRRLSGDARFDLALNGPAALSSISGLITTAGARLSAPNLSTALTDINADVRLSGASANLSVNAGITPGGRLEITGPIALSGGYNADLTIALRDLILRDPNLYETTASGDLSVSGPLTGGARITGAIALGQVDVDIPSSSFGAAGDLPDITHINAPADVRASLGRAGLLEVATSGTGGTTRPYPIDVRINATSQIFVRGRGLDAELGGSLRLTGTTANIIPQGQFSLVRGRFSILGQRFDIDEGLITLQGDFDPQLRLVAQTETTSAEISVVLEGALSEPEIQFLSNPEMPQEEVLAQLLFGRSISSISPLQAIQLASAVATLAGRGGGVVDTLRQSFGLDDFDVSTTSSGETQLRAGAYLSENIYTDFAVTSGGTSEINLNLDISDSFTAKGGIDSSGDSSLGIFFERDY